MTLLTRTKHEDKMPCFATYWESPDPPKGFEDMEQLEKAIRDRADFMIKNLVAKHKREVEVYIGTSTLAADVRLSASGVGMRWANLHKGRRRVGIIILGEFHTEVVSGSLSGVGRRWLACDMEEKLHNWMDTTVVEQFDTIKHNSSSKSGGGAGSGGVPVVYMTWRFLTEPADAKVEKTDATVEAMANALQAELRIDSDGGYL